MGFNSAFKGLIARWDKSIPSGADALTPAECKIWEYY